MMKKILFSLLCLIGLSSVQMANAAAIVATLDGTGKIMTIKYLNAAPSGGKFDFEWSEWKDQVETVIFDATMASATPQSTKEWFKDFSKLTSISNIENLNTANVTDMSEMFRGCIALASLDVTHFNTANVTTMYGMFRDCRALTSIAVGYFDTQKVTDMGFMFADCQALTALNLNSFKTENVTDMRCMFQNCYELATLNILNLKTGNVQFMHFMFYNCKKLKYINVYNFDTKNVGHMFYMFYHCDAVTSLRLNNFDMSKVTDVRGMFQSCANLKTIYCNNDWSEMTNITSSTDMFSGCTSLEGGTGTLWDSEHTDKGLACPDLTNQPGYFTKVNTEVYCTLEGTNTLRVWYGENYGNKTMDDYRNDDNITTIEIRGTMQDYEPTSLKGFFKDFKKVTEIKNLALNLVTSEATDMSEMFYNCQALTSIDLSQFNTEKVTTMSQMFENCYALTSLDLTSFNTSKVTSMYHMFTNCQNLQTADISSFDPSKLTTTQAMFALCYKLTTIYNDLDWSKFTGINTNVMFQNSSKIVGGNGTTYEAEKNDGTYARPDLINQKGYFTYGACQTPSNPVIASITYNQAVITWEPLGAEKQWTVGWAKSGQQEQAVIVTEPTITLVNLEPETTYGLNVKANCTTSSTSERTIQIAINTPAEPTCPLPTAVNVTDITHNSAVINIESEGSYWNLRYKKEGAGIWTLGGGPDKTMTLTDLEPLTSYYVEVQTSCADIAKESEWFVVGSFLTGSEPTCPAPTNLTYSNVTATSVTLDWTSGGDEEEWNLLWKTLAEEGFIHGTSLGKDEHPYTWTTLLPLTPNTTYQMKIQAKCGAGLYSDDSNVIEFTTSPATALEDIEAERVARKVIENGQLIIEFNGKTYNAQGAQLR